MPGAPLSSTNVFFGIWKLNLLAGDSFLSLYILSIINLFQDPSKQHLMRKTRILFENLPFMTFQVADFCLLSSPTLLQCLDQHVIFLKLL